MSLTLDSAVPPNRQSFERPRLTASTGGRDAAIRRLSRQAGRFPDLDPGGPVTDSLDDREGAFAIALYEGAIRRWITLRYLLGRHMARPYDRTEPAVKAVLLAGAAQLVVLDRIPAHAAISESVEWAKRRIRPGAGKLVNAVLRRVADDVVRADDGLPTSREVWTDRRDELPLGDGRARVLGGELLPEDEIERLGVTTGLSVDLLGRWTGQTDAPTARSRAIHTLCNAPIILNIRHDPDMVGDLIMPHDVAGHAVFSGTRTQLTALFESHPSAWVQDAASGGAVESISDLEPGLIVDSCAGVGTKTRQLAATFPHAEIIATDVDSPRLRTLRSVFKAHDRVRIVEPGALVDAALGRADLILLDVPCSNSGVLARRLEARHRVNAKTLARLVGVQRGIIADAIPLLAPHGSILYSTCSLEREENDAQLDWASRSYDFEPERVRRAEPRGGPGDLPTAYTDGAFSALLVR